MIETTPQNRAITKIAVIAVWLAPLVIMAGLIVACSQITDQVFDKRISEGVIEYRITFPEIGHESITAALLPDKMTYAFRETGFATYFETAGGMFKNNIIADLDRRSLEHQLKVFRKKVRVNMNEMEINRMISQYPKMTVIKTNEVDTIAGYPCLKALIVFEDVGLSDIEVYYTDQIKMLTPNWCTQYHEIEGVLMAYEIQEFGIRMRLEAIAVKPVNHTPEVFKGSEDYENITREMMDVELAQLVETFDL